MGSEVPYNRNVKRKGTFMRVIETQIQSKRDTQIPVTIVEADVPSKLLLCVHGFKAKRTEDGRFLTVARQLR